MGTYVRYPCAHTTKKPLPTVGGFLERLVKRDANPASHRCGVDGRSIPETQARCQKARPPHISVRGPDCSRQRLVTMLWGKTAK